LDLKQTFFLARSPHKVGVSNFGRRSHKPNDIRESIQGQQKSKDKDPEAHDCGNEIRLLLGLIGSRALLEGQQNICHKYDCKTDNCHVKRNLTDDARTKFERSGSGPLCNRPKLFCQKATRIRHLYFVDLRPV
jgi:hypothetical protein